MAARSSRPGPGGREGDRRAARGTAVPGEPARAPKTSILASSLANGSGRAGWRVWRHVRAVSPRPRWFTAGPHAAQSSADLQHELTVPFATAISGGEARLKIQRKGGATETISVKIPPGIEEGKKIRLRGQGEKPARGAPGDILITVHVAPHPYFQRRGDDLHVKVPVTLAEAAEGAKVDVPTPGGTITLCVPPRTSSGRRLRVRGRGVPKRDGKAGDLYAEVQIVLPTSLDEQSLQWMRQISTQYGSNPRSELKW